MSGTIGDMIDFSRIRPEHRTTTVCGIVKAIDERRDWSMVPVLLDALYDAGAEQGNEFLPPPPAVDRRRWLDGHWEPSPPRSADVLFIGGPRDGARATVELRDYFHADVWEGGGPLNMWRTMGMIRTVTYRLVPLRGGPGIFYCYVIDGMTAEEAMRRLFAGYDARRFQEQVTTA